MTKLLVGLVKGIVLGAIVGYGFQWLTVNLVGPDNWVAAGYIGGLVGLFVGRPIWRNILDKEATAWVSVIKAVVGFGVGVGLYFLVNSFLHVTLTTSVLDAYQTKLQNIPVIFGGVVGALYGAFVELDDSLDDDKTKPKKLAEKVAAKK
jgi:hypothetical protein